MNSNRSRWRVAAKTWTRALQALTTALLLLAGFLASLPARADLADTVVRLKPSVVLVGTYEATDSPRFTFRGTGFVVGSGNLAVTNAHVLPEPGAAVAAGKQLMVRTWTAPNQWSERIAKQVSVDRLHDLAVLSFEGPPVNPLKLSSGVPREGSGVAFMGFPIGGALGFSHVTHRATISALTSVALPAPTAATLNSRNISQLRAGAFNLMQLDGTAYPGNSGGPVFDIETGEVLGVVNMVLLKGTKESVLAQPSGISYAIPVEAVARLLNP
ncbi:S1 family peptidase [Roseateles violae]|uniref:Serine protease n=1 Tax=Roseateles violae TaxID=3058042 RepID=A0ABT8DQZ1_9BURK|nr:serine protease [Pelomonas sp. PFR6]MDN3920436.1 serine protease [Pelomonas sp. PFR6]